MDNLWKLERAVSGIMESSIEDVLEVKQWVDVWLKRGGNLNTPWFTRGFPLLSGNSEH